MHRLALAAGGEVVGRAVSEPFADVAFHAAAPRWGLTGTARYASGVAAALRSISPDLVEVHNRPEVALLLARRFPRVMLVLHNDPQGMRGTRTAAGRTRLLRRLCCVAVVSEQLRRRFLEGASGEVVVLPNSIDVPPRVRRVRDRVILFAGRVVADKGADAFVQACAAVLPRLPGWRAEMVGADRFSPDSPPTAFTEQIRIRAAQAGVSMPGYLPHSETLERLSRAAIAVVPSRWPEPFGLTALEAMAHGAALVCSRRGALPDVAGECALYADPDTPSALAAAIMALANDGERRTALASAAWQRARSFDTIAAADRLRALRNRLIAC